MGCLRRHDSNGGENWAFFEPWCDYPNKLYLSNVSELSWSWSLEKNIQVEKENEKIVFVCSRSQYNVKLGILSRSHAVTATKCTKKRAVRHVQSCYLADLRLFTIPDSFLAATKIISIGLLFTRKNGRGGPTSVTERSCADGAVWTTIRPVAKINK